MPAGATYTTLATTTLSTSTATVTFSSISGAYTDLVLVCRHATAADANTQLRFNSDTGTNYSSTFLRGSGSTASSTRDSNQTVMSLESNGFPTPAFGAITIAHIMNYANTTTYKTTLSRGSNANTGSGVSAVAHLWRSTAAVTSMTLLSTSTFSSGSEFSLYGITAA